MVMGTDALLERIRIKNQVKKWRNIAISVPVLLVFLFVSNSQGSSFSGFSKDYIARININGIITGHKDKVEIISNLAKDKKLKAVILHIDSPGGTAVGGEVLYNAIERLNEKKPVVVVMNNVAASAGYLIAIPAERIFAHRATVTGSIGVILQSPNISVLAKKLGIKMDIVKTGAEKGEPSILGDMTPETRKIMQSVVDDFYDFFVKTIAEKRNMSEIEVRKLADGRIYTGQQAVDNKLVDEIGFEEEAVAWLRDNKDIKSSVKIRDVKLVKKKKGLEGLLSTFMGNKSLIPEVFSLQGLLSIWQKGAIQ